VGEENLTNHQISKIYSEFCPVAIIRDDVSLILGNFGFQIIPFIFRKFICFLTFSLKTHYNIIRGNEKRGS